MGEVKLEEDVFDKIVDPDGNEKTIKRYTWTNSNGVRIQAITYGATITAIYLPDKNGHVQDIVMGFNDLKGYRGALNPYFGATIGRVANRVGYSMFTVDGQQYQLSTNLLGEHQLHGGFKGFDKVVWESYSRGNTVTMSYLSRDGEEGYPGDVLTNVTYRLNENNEFTIEFKATTTKPTYINLTNHSYFNLAGHDKGAEELYKHVVSVNADRITEVDKNSIPTGKLLPVAGTIFDLQTPKVLGDVIHNVPGYTGYDHNFCVNKGVYQDKTFVARVTHPTSGRTMEVYSDQPGVQFYTSNFIPEHPEKFKGDPKTLAKLSGKGANYYAHGAFCLETQNYPDAANHKNFPKAIFYPGETYTHRVSYKFYLV